MSDFFIKSFEQVLNRYLALDSESSQRLQRLEGKIITFELRGIAVTFQLKILAQKIYLQQPVEEPDVMIRGTPLSLMFMSIFKSERKKFFAEDVSIEGNLELGQQIIDLFDEMEIDWEEHLSQCVGDVPAHQLGKFVRKIKQLSQRTRDVLLQNVNEYVHEEAELFPQREALQDFFHDIDVLRMDADRLESRIKHIINQEDSSR